MNNTIPVFGIVRAARDPVDEEGHKQAAPRRSFGPENYVLTIRRGELKFPMLLAIQNFEQLQGFLHVCSKDLKPNGGRCG